MCKDESNGYEVRPGVCCAPLSWWSNSSRANAILWHACEHASANAMCSHRPDCTWSTPGPSVEVSGGIYGNGHHELRRYLQQRVWSKLYEW